MWQFFRCTAHHSAAISILNYPMNLTKCLFVKTVILFSPVMQYKIYKTIVYWTVVMILDRKRSLNPILYVLKTLFLSFKSLTNKKT